MTIIDDEICENVIKWIIIKNKKENNFIDDDNLKTSNKGDT